MCAQRTATSVSPEGRFAGQAFEEDTPERIEVGSPVDLPFLDLLGCHVVVPTNLSLFRPGTRSFASAEPIQVLRCGGYFTYTPGIGGSGRYTLLVTGTDERPGRQRYHLQAAVAGPDDMAPGLPIRDAETRRGSLSGTLIDVVDLYRFRVLDQSDVTLRLAGPGSSHLILLSETGRRLSSSGGPGPLTTRLGPGRYFVAVRAESGARGPYRLSLLERHFTTTTVLANGSRVAHVSPGSSVAIGVTVDFSADGSVRLEIDRFDPLTGWHFYRLYRLRLGGNGRTGIAGGLRRSAAGACTPRSEEAEPRARAWEGRR